MCTTLKQVLNQLAPDHFNPTWLSKINDVGANMRLRGNNLRKVLNGILDYYKDVIGLQIPREFPLPDVNRVLKISTPKNYINNRRLVTGGRGQH